ncbi:MAG: type II toxin-antitoxin system PemK/MazF family toxin [Parcubacteria group bacterium]|nr:type II toxin-antitoxin system PemK/MazF family toxin [Parcubacteria group bacterium]
MKQGEIWLVRYDPSIGHEFQKTRPAIIISSNDVLKYSNVATVVAVTGDSDNKILDDIELRKDDRNNFYKNSVAKIHHINSFDKSRFIKKIGELKNEDFEKIRNCLKNYFKL